MAYVNIVFPSGISSQYSGAFTNSARYWNNVLTTAPVNPITFGSSFSVASLCGVSFTYPAGSTLVGLDIFSSVVSIDGVGSVLGSAGPCGFTGDIPRLGIMRFDSADVNGLINNGNFEEVIKHEMAHVIGIGTVWSRNGLISGSGSSNPTYNGANGRSGYAALGGSGNVPVANTGGAGTREGHWREATFQNELMTGFLSSGRNPLSIMTVRSLRDMGYNVNEGAAESYSLPKEETEEVGEVNMEGDFLEFPHYELDALVAENDAIANGSNNSFENGMVGAIAVTAILALVALVTLIAKKSKNSKTVITESQV